MKLNDPKLQELSQLKLQSKIDMNVEAGFNKIKEKCEELKSIEKEIRKPITENEHKHAQLTTEETGKHSTRCYQVM